MNRKVFITDGHWRKSLAAVRALGKKGVGVTVGESTRMATAFFSKHASRRVVYPSPLFEPSKFQGFLYDELSRNHYQMFLPMEDETLALIAKKHNEFSRLAYLPIVTSEKLDLARSKDKILQLAEKLGVPTPRTWYVDDTRELDHLLKELPFPVVIKPRVSSGAVGICYVECPKDLPQLYRLVHKRFPYPLIQERIPHKGHGYGASLLFDENGKLKASFVHKRLREYPITGGASTLRESVRRDDIRDMAVTLLEALDWFGVAMVEFKEDPRDGIVKLMEINPRFWGSLFLAVEAGVNFPYLLFRMSLGEKIEPVESYELGKKCRWLLPGDILHFIANPKRNSLLPQFLRIFEKDTAYDILSLGDPLPVLGRLLTPLTFLYDRDMKYRLKRRGL